MELHKLGTNFTEDKKLQKFYPINNLLRHLFSDKVYNYSNHSSFVNIDGGVPQGQILEPLLLT